MGPSVKISLNSKMTLETQSETQPIQIEINPSNPDSSFVPVYFAAGERFTHPDTGKNLFLPELKPGTVIQLPMSIRESGFAHYLVVSESANKPKQRLLLQPLLPEEVEKLKKQRGDQLPDVIINFTPSASQGLPLRT